MVTDHEWVIVHVSSDVKGLLGSSPETYKNVPLLGLVQPADVQAFILAVGRVAADGGGATLRMHLRSGDNQWRDVWCLVLALCDHSPPRLGLAVSAVSESGEELSSELHKQLGVLGGDVIGGMDQCALHVPSETLSTRQWEVVTRLVRGERVKDIAAELYLSPTTVRNHLTAIYRKFGVHSQTALMAKLLYAPD
jgi:DNA-binding CsgD family transcriptional regulator